MNGAGPASAYLDQERFHKLWMTTLPNNSCDKGFWSALETHFAPLLSETCVLRSAEFFSLPHTGRIEQADVHLIDKDVAKTCNEVRPLYDAFTLLNPRYLAAVLKVSLDTVVEQLLLAVAQRWMALRFVVPCTSCACDITHHDAVSLLPFVGTFHSSNAFRCPICTDRTELSELKDVAVFFQLERLHPVFHRLHHRHCCTELAVRRRLECFFCPAGAGFAFTAHLPRGRYLLAAPFMAAFAELQVDVGAEAMGPREAFLPKIIDLKQYSFEERKKLQPGEMGGSHGAQLRRRQSRRTTAFTSQPRPGMSVADAFGFGGQAGGGGNNNNNMGTSQGSFGAVELEPAPPTPVLTLKHGKVLLRMYNSTSYSGFMSLSVAFDPRTEFAAVEYPHQLTVPDFMHCLPRGLRSALVKRCIPRPPSTTRTTGVYVRHVFVLSGEDFTDPSITAVLREVHCYSVEDHQGLLLGVSCGGTAFESSFLSVTAALASSICFFQRVLVRLGERVALCMRCSATEGPLAIASYQGQYNDADNMRSSYPDIQFVGAVLYASEHPPICPHRLTAYEEELPRQSEAGTGGGALAYLHRLSQSDLGGQEVVPGQPTAIRFELRSVSRDLEDGGLGYRGAGDAYAAVCLHDDYRDGTREPILPFFLDYLCEHFAGTVILAEPHALVVQMPLPVILASVQMSTTLSAASYTKTDQGPF